MWKKCVTTILCMLMASLLVACGSKIPDGMAEETYNTGMKALEIMDKYNDGDISSEEAGERLDSLYTKLDNLDNLKSEADNEYGLSEDDQNRIVATHISNFQFIIGLVGERFSDSDSYTAADELRDMLNNK